MTLAVSVLFSCGGEPSLAPFNKTENGLNSGATTGAGVLENGLPYDGCTWVVRIGDRPYGPSEGSVGLIEAFTHNTIGKTSATIEYQVTGNQVAVSCGWGSTDVLDEIVILSLR